MDSGRNEEDLVDSTGLQQLRCELRVLPGIETVRFQHDVFATNTQFLQTSTIDRGLRSTVPGGIPAGDEEHAIASLDFAGFVDLESLHEPAVREQGNFRGRRARDRLGT